MCFEFCINLLPDHDMDGLAIAAAFATTPGPDCLKDVLPKLGQRLRIFQNLIEV